MIPYGKHFINNDDIESVVDVLKSDWLTTGPIVDAFESAVASYVDARYAIAVSNGTAALHSAMYAIKIRPGDEVIVPTITFLATANCVRYLGGTPVFADVQADTLLIDPEDVRRKITPKTKAIVAVDYAGQPCDYSSLRKICNQYGLSLVSDACHALGASYDGNLLGSIADLTVFSFHPVKHITTGEGGMIVTNQKKLKDRIKRFRNHGIDNDFRAREKHGSWHYEMSELGYNFRITDIQCALGLSQLKKLPDFLDRRRKIAARYQQAFSESLHILPLKVNPNIDHAYHLFVVQLNTESIGKTRKDIFQQLRSEGIGVNVHYIPVHLQPYYREKLGTRYGDCPVAEKMYQKIISLPIFPHMTESQINIVIDKSFGVIEKNE